MQNKQKNIIVGISSCLLGQKVRFDANHKHSKLVTGTLGEHWQYLPICPEMAIGMGVPRQPIHLHGDMDSPSAVGVFDKSLDVTEQLVRFGQQKAQSLDHISGYIFKKGSPSCGMQRVKVYQGERDILSTAGVGLYAKQIMQHNPLLPVEEEGRLNDETLCENFVQRVHVYHRWQRLMQSGISAKKLVDFHTKHKFSLLAHCETTYRELGRMIADVGRTDIHKFAEEYILKLMTGLKKPATRSRHCNVLMHMMGFIKRHLDRDDKHELITIIDNYKSGVLPLSVPVTLLLHHLRRSPSRYIAQQYYLKHVAPCAI